MPRQPAVSPPRLCSPPRSTHGRALQPDAGELRARLEAFYDEAAAGTLSSSALARFECRLLLEISVAEKRARRTQSAPLLQEAADSDAEATWNRLTPQQRREVVSLLCSIRVLRGKPGALLRPGDGRDHMEGCRDAARVRRRDDSARRPEDRLITTSRATLRGGSEV